MRYIKDLEFVVQTADKRTVCMSVVLGCFKKDENKISQRLDLLSQRRMQKAKKKHVGKYSLLMSEMIGQGAFSSVYLGQHRETMEPVAVKVVDKYKIEEDEYTKHAFYMEIQIMRHLRSKNIIKFHDVHQTQRNYYIITELAQSGTLRSLIKQKKFTQSEGTKCMTQILNGFKQLIKFGIIHRDIKPDNILVKDGLLKIADFGFAKQSQNFSFMKSIVGTPIYMSPQLLNFEQYSYKCDIWALGVIFYELIVGKIPWDLTHKNMISNIKANPIIFPATVSKQVQQFILKCLAYEEKDRYDWEQIYSHPLFVEKFKVNFNGPKHNILKLAFINSDLRMSIHSQNIDIIKMLKTESETFNFEQFQMLINRIDTNIKEGEISIIFNTILQKGKSENKITVEELIEYFKGAGIRIKMVNLSESQAKNELVDEAEQNKTHGIMLLSHLHNIIEEKDLDIQELYSKEERGRKNALGLSEFSKMVFAIDPDLTSADCAILFQQFNTNREDAIKYSQFYATLCKIPGISKSQHSRK